VKRFSFIHTADLHLLRKLDENIPVREIKEERVSRHRAWSIEQRAADSGQLAAGRFETTRRRGDTETRREITSRNC
jgi:hypothetical protein